MQLGGTNGAPLPTLPFDAPVYFAGREAGGFPAYVYDDTDVDYTPMAQWQQDGPLGPDEPGEGGDGPSGPNYGPNDLWLEVRATNDLAYLTLHGTWATNLYDVQLRTNLTDQYWSPGQIQYYASDGATDFDPVPTTNSEHLYFRAQCADDVVYCSAAQDARETNSAINDPGQVGIFYLARTRAPVTPLTLAYRLSGTASNGFDYTTLTGIATIPANARDTYVYVQPIVGSAAQFEQTVTLTLTPTNGYLVNGFYSSATVIIGSYPFTPVARLALGRFSRFQIRTVPSRPPLASRIPSGEKHTA